MINIRNKILIFCTAIMLIALLMLTGFMPACIAYAETSNNKFDNTPVVDDLSNTDLSQYVYDKDGGVALITFVEYCYSANALNYENYGLYLYVYNPSRLFISERTGANTVELATKYGGDGQPCDYENVPLKLCGISTGELKKLIYKFKVIDNDGKILKNARTHDSDSGYRRYDVAGVQIWETGKNNATDYGVGGTYKFTGYAKGYGTDINAESNLLCSLTELETVKLDVKHTFYRTKTSVKGAGYQNQLDTAYFAVPKRLFDEYGKLQRIKAEWYEYKTKDIVVSSNQDFYNKANPYLGIQPGPFDRWGMTEYNKDIGISLGQDAGDYGGGMMAAKWGWNLGGGYLHVPAATMNYLFEVNDINEYDPYADIVENGGVESNALYEYIKHYDRSYNGGTLPIKGGTISADLFADDIDGYRKLDTQYGKIQNGYSYYDFDADLDLQKLSSWQEGNPSFWDNWINWGLWDAIFGGILEETSRTVSPIYTVKEADFNGTSEQVSERLLVNADDVSNLSSFHNQAKSEDKVVVLFRFATSDYYSAPVDIIELGKGFLGNDKFTKGQAYRAWESVFFDFDIIQLSFQKDGKYTVIPAVANPIDVVNAITPPVDMPDTDWWKILLAVALGIVLLILLFPVLPWIIKGVIGLICLPFKLIGKIFKRKKKEKRVKEKKLMKINIKKKESGMTDDKNNDWNLDDMDLWEEME